MSRVAFARVYLGGQWTLPHQTANSVGHALARLKPTWVAGLLRYENGERATATQVRIYDTIRRLVEKKAPDAQFGIEMNALEYKTPSDVQEDMGALRSKLHNDGWYFDFFTSAWQKRPNVVRAIVDDAHSHDQWIGGNAFGWKTKPEVPPGADFLAVTDRDFNVDIPAVRALAEHVPVLLHTRNNPGNRISEGCEWLKRLTTAQREAYVRQRAKQQAKGHYHFAYPVFFPTCNLPRITSFDAVNDGSMFRTIERLMSKYG